MKKNGYKRIAGAAAALMCSGCLAISALAVAPTTGAYEDGPASNLWLSVVEIPTQAQVSVTVPMSYGFVVVGDATRASTDAIKRENGNLLLPNVRVVVNTPSAPGVPGDYSIVTVSESQIKLRNYSTDVREEHLEDENPPHEGIPVELEPFIIEEPNIWLNTVVVGQHYWEPIANEPTTASEDFKKYRMGIDGMWFNQPDTYSDGTTTVDSLRLNGRIQLPAPPDVLTNGYDASGVANVPSETNVDMTVQVGGTQGQYYQVEQSVKVGAIGWKVIPGELPPAP